MNFFSLSSWICSRVSKKWNEIRFESSTILKYIFNPKVIWECGSKLMNLPASVRVLDQFYVFLFDITTITNTAGTSFTTSEPFLKYDWYTWRFTNASTDNPYLIQLMITLNYIRVTSITKNKTTSLCIIMSMYSYQVRIQKYDTIIRRRAYFIIKGE